MGKKEEAFTEDSHKAIMINIMINKINEPRHEKTGFLHMRKTKDADQLCVNREADQCLCFRYNPTSS